MYLIPTNNCKPNCFLQLHPTKHFSEPTLDSSTNENKLAHVDIFCVSRYFRRTWPRLLSLWRWLHACISSSNLHYLFFCMATKRIILHDWERLRGTHWVSQKHNTCISWRHSVSILQRCNASKALTNRDHVKTDPAPTAASTAISEITVIPFLQSIVGMQAVSSLTAELNHIDSISMERCPHAHTRRSWGQSHSFPTVASGDLSHLILLIPIAACRED